MKYFIVILLALLLFSCEEEEEDFIYNYPEFDKLLVSATRTGSNSEYITEFKYDSLNRLVELKNTMPESQIVIESYVYDEESRIVEKRNGNHVTTYFYNAEGQLTEQYIKYESPSDDYEWGERTEFKYKNGKIDKGIIYSGEGEITSTIRYKYDSRGNTLEKTVHPAGSDYDFNLIEIKFRYDSKVNPFGNSGVNLLNGYIYTRYADIKQVNNPVYSSYTNMISSSLPPEYEISYEYDSDGLPVKAVLNNALYSEPKPEYVTYEYRNAGK